LVPQKCHKDSNDRERALTDLIPEQDDDTQTSALERKHWLALVAVFAVVELVWLISVLS
jgi:hypothetical protein